MTSKIISLFLILFMSASISAQDKNQIDDGLAKCLDSKSSTADQRNCLGTAYNSWDKELNRYYSELSKKLPKSVLDELITSQRNWLKFRDAEFKLINKYYFEVKEGTIFYVIGDQKKMEIVKDRALQLKEFCDLLVY